MIPKEETVR